MKIKITVEVHDAVGAREFSIDVATDCAEFERDPRAHIAACADAFIRDEPNWVGKVVEEAKEVDAAQATVSAAQKRLAAVANERRHMLAK